MGRAFVILCFFVSGTLSAQLSYKIDQTIPVKNGSGEDLALAWGGGLNAAQYNTMDLDNNGDDDLVLFDRMANKVITFLNVDNEYQYHPEYEILFPQGLRNWMLLRDFNCDGKKDIFTSDLLGIKVFENVTADGELLTWKHFLFYTGGSGPKSEVILTKGFSGLINIQIQFDDLPAITDADGDGDLDIFTVRFGGNGSIEYHKNFSKERFNSCDSLTFERQTQKWGNFNECHCGEFAFNGADCPTGGRTKHAGGKTLLAIDANGDNNIDIVFSESECTNLYLFTNEGTADAPVINSFSTFPANTPVDLTIFPGAFYEDVNFDGIKDLIATPNIFEKEVDDTNLEQSNWFYNNAGTNSQPDFQFSKNDFLQDKMIDVGDNAVPALADVEGDGDLDLFVSRNASLAGPSTVWLFENKGSPAIPSFELVDTDYLDFSQTELTNLKIQFKDLNQDRSLDFVFTATNSSNATRLYYIANQNSSSLNFQGQTPVMITFPFTYNENICIADVNTDGKQDIIVGRNNGALEYWRNTGTVAAPTYALDDPEFLDFGSSITSQNISGYASDLDGDGIEDLVLGDNSGVIRIAIGYKTQTNIIEPVFNPLMDSTVNHNFGGQVWPVAGRIDDGSSSIILGNILGGLQMLKGEGGFSVFPNPIIKGDALTITADEDLTLNIYGSAGQHVAGPVVIEPTSNSNYKIGHLSAGFYIFHFRGKNNTYVRKIVIQ